MICCSEKSYIRMKILKKFIRVAGVNHESNFSKRELFTLFFLKKGIEVIEQLQHYDGNNIEGIFFFVLISDLIFLIHKNLVCARRAWHISCSPSQKHFRKTLRKKSARARRNSKRNEPWKFF